MVAFVVSFVSPHTLPLGRELSKYQEVVFINTIPLTEERRRMGYDINDDCVKIYNISDEREKCQYIIDNADYVIFAGAFGFDVLKKRLSENKTTFIMHERIFKKGIIKWLDPRTHELARFCRAVRKKNVYLLSIGDNSARDFKKLGFCKDKIFRFGYFPALEEFRNHTTISDNEMCRILWVGRMLDFKRPFMAIKAMRRLPDGFKLSMIGDGKLFAKAKKIAKRKNIDVEFFGNQPRDFVIKSMRESHILLSTSNKGEGWGVVINEGMNHGCAIVCSDKIGCYGTLANENNAKIFRCNSVRSLADSLVEAKRDFSRLSTLAENTVKQKINPVCAAERLNHLMLNTADAFSEGICSKAFKKE